MLFGASVRSCHGRQTTPIFRFMSLLHPQPLVARTPAAVASLALRSLLFSAPARRRRSLLLPCRTPRVEAREAAIARYLAELPAGAAVTVCQVLREVPGLRLLPEQGSTVAMTLRVLGWRANKGFAEFVREASPMAPRCGSRVHPAIVSALPRIMSFLGSVPQGGTVTERQVAEGCGVALPNDHRRRAIGRQLRRMGWHSVGRGSPLYARGAA